MEFKYLDIDYEKESFVLPSSARIDDFLLKNHSNDIKKTIEFMNTDGKLLYIHGFLGTGKRQVINYLSGFFNKDVIKLEYYCKPSTVCDDILISFIDIIEKNALSKVVSQTAKVTTLTVNFLQYLSSIKKPFVVILHSYDDIAEENISLISDLMNKVLQNSNVKIILSTRAMLQTIFGEVKADKKIFLKALSTEVFKELIATNNVSATDDAIESFYKYSRGYYYYTLLAIKVMQAMQLSLNDFLAKFSMSGMSFDSYLGFTYVNLIPNTIRNFFWFLRTIRHGISINALAVYGLYDEFSVGYLKNNLMIYQADEMIYVQDYFQQDIDISIPVKTEIKLHKYIIGIYEKELKESLQTRSILISRQALRAEIEYHGKKISELEKNQKSEKTSKAQEEKKLKESDKKEKTHEELTDLNQKMHSAKKLADEKKHTEAIEAYLQIAEDTKIDSNTLAEVRVELGREYKAIGDYPKSQHYYEVAEEYYKSKDEYINLNYLYYELTILYFDMYKIERAIETVKKVIYSVDTPQSLLIDACTLLGSIYSETKVYDKAAKYYQKALESIDENTTKAAVSELYFKYALMCDENENASTAFEYYNKCIALNYSSPYKALAYSNMGACYFENDNLSDAESCFIKAYTIEKDNNNYEGIYYTASYLAKIYSKTQPSKTYNFLVEAKQSAEFINEDFYMLEATIALGDYYYDLKDKNEDALKEYFKALRIAKNYGDMVDIDKIEERIKDMKIRVGESAYTQIEAVYGK